MRKTAGVLFGAAIATLVATPAHAHHGRQHHRHYSHHHARREHVARPPVRLVWVVHAAALGGYLRCGLRLGSELGIITALALLDLALAASLFSNFTMWALSVAMVQAIVGLLKAVTMVTG